MEKSNQGTILLKLYDDKGIIRDVYLQKTLYIPSYPHDIFSVRSALEKGGMVILKPNDGELILKDGTTFPISVKNGLYYLDLENGLFPEVDTVNSCKPPTVRSLSLAEWHQILGHVNQNDILKLESVVHDMQITAKKTNTPCDICTLSKQVVYRNREPDERATAPLEFVHSDLAGPIEPIAKDGLRYVINFVDDFTGCSFVYFLKNKSDAPTALQKFLCDVAPYGKVQFVTSRLRLQRR